MRGKNNKYSKLILFLPVFFVSVYSLPVNAQKPLPGTETRSDTRSMGMANAQRFTSANTTGIYLNPATISMAHAYQMNLKYKYYGDDKLHNGGVALLDSITSPNFAAGVSLDYLKDSKQKSDFKAWDFRLALASNIADIFYFGATTRFISVEHDLESGSMGPNKAPALLHVDDRQIKGITMDAGVVLSLARFLNFGLVGYNLTHTESVFAPLKLATGLALTPLEMFSIEADLIVDFTSYSSVALELNTGAEMLFSGMFALRTGYARDFHLDQNKMTFGFGVYGRAAGFDFAYAQDLGSSSRFRLAFGLIIFIG